MLLDLCDEGVGPGVLRFWEPRETFVVLGYGNSAATEVNVDACQADRVPILRRCSGGGTVLQAPGCLNYSVVLPVDFAPALAGVTETNRFFMERHRLVLSQLLARDVQVQGFTDLTLGGRKFSGNAQRRKRAAVLFHGTFLLRFDLGLVERYLSAPSRQPAYRAHRHHADFLTCLDVGADPIKAALRAHWNAVEAPVEIPQTRLEQLVRHRDDGSLRFAYSAARAIHPPPTTRSS